MSKEDERRDLPRVQAPILCRPKRRGLFAPRQRVIDASLGGIRLYSDEKLKVGQQFELEVLAENDKGKTIQCEAQVAWVKSLGDDGPAKYEVGLQFISLAKDDQETLQDLLVHDDDAS